MKENKIADIGIYTNIHESGKINKDGNKMYFATCRVCGTVVEKKLSNIKRSNKVCRHKQKEFGKVNDMPTGWINQSDLNKKIYNTWKGMIFRTTQKCWERFPTYAGTTVDDSWLKLSNFVRDIKELSGYDEWVSSEPRMMMLDKDTIVNGNKHYSKETCCFITAKESCLDVNKRHPECVNNARNYSIKKTSVPVKITNKATGEEKFFTSLIEACREMNWNFRNAWMVLSESCTDHHSIKGWLIERINTDSNIDGCC